MTNVHRSLSGASIDLAGNAKGFPFQGLPHGALGTGLFCPFIKKMVFPTLYAPADLNSSPPVIFVCTRNRPLKTMREGEKERLPVDIYTKKGDLLHT